ncbi:MAG: ATP-binding protein [Parachlamydiales bacterium]|jgi:signal transduction histidine kinase
MSENFLQNLDPIMLKTRFNIQEEELEIIRQSGVEAKKYLDVFIEDMYKWMPSLREFKTFFINESMIPHVKFQQKAYWAVFFNGRIDQDYVKNRTTIGFTHARINLPINTYCVGMNFSIEWWMSRTDEFISDHAKSALFSSAFRKLCSLDIALITESYSQLMNDKVKALLDDTNSILDKVTMVAESIAIGDFSQGYKSTGEQDKRLSAAINQMMDNLKEVVKQTKIIAQGRYDIEFTPLSDLDELGKAVSEMTRALREMSYESKKSAWIKTGQAELSNIMRGDQDLRELGKNIISFLSKYAGALMGTIYQVDYTMEKTLELVGSYAFHRRKGDRSKIQFGEGLVGQCALEKEIIVFSNVPDDYTTISSSLGEAIPKNILVSPLLIEKELIGVMELASHDVFDSTKMELLRQVSENVAIALKSCQNSEKMKFLLDDSKRQSDELQAQQEELRCTNEELQSQQEMLRKSNEELERQTSVLKKSEEEIKNKNEELNLKTTYLETQSSEIKVKSTQIEKAKGELEHRAKELELASKYKSEFLANMSHELRTPLNSLLILSKSLAENEDGNLTKEQIESASVIHRGGQDLLTLINDILDLSKVEAGKLQIQIDEVKFQSIIENLKRSFGPIANERGLQFVQEIYNLSNTTLKTDGHRAEQILKNFLSNAFKFTQKGSVTFKIHPPAPQTQFRSPLLSPYNCIGFSVIDTGIGISKDKQDIIFQAFQQGDGSTSRKYGGTGLGLSISRELSRILNGEIHIESEIGKGSTFTLYLPLEHKEAVTEKKKEWASLM